MYSMVPSKKKNPMVAAQRASVKNLAIFTIQLHVQDFTGGGRRGSVFSDMRTEWTQRGEARARFTCASVPRAFGCNNKKRGKHRLQSPHYTFSNVCFLHRTTHRFFFNLFIFFLITGSPTRTVSQCLHELHHFCLLFDQVTF